MNGYIGNDNREQKERSTDTGALINSEWDSVPSLVTGATMFFSEQPGETFTQKRGNSLLRVSPYITIFPSESSLGFRNRGPEPVTPSMWNTGVFRSDH